MTMRTWRDIAWTGVVAVLIYRRRSAAVLVCLLAVLVPYITAIAISQGVERDAMLSIEYGADLYVSVGRFGQQAPAPVEAIDGLTRIEGVESVTPRIVGAVQVGRESLDAVLVGVPASRLPESTELVDGRWFRDAESPELVLGWRLARRLGLKPGDRIPPLMRSSRGERTPLIVGVFRSSVALWDADLILTSWQAAAAMYDEPGMATELLVECREGYSEAVRREILRRGLSAERASLRAMVTTRDQLRASLPSELSHREGVFNLHFLLAVAVGSLAITVTSGLGLSQRRREIGVLKATGWQTDEVLMRAAFECLVLSLLGAGLAVLIAVTWLSWFDGRWIAGVYLVGDGGAFDWPPPYAITPLPSLLSVVLALVMTSTGSLYSTWRAAVAPPWLALKQE